MQIVFLVWFRDFQSELQLCGVYSSRERAEAFASWHSDGAQMEISECEMDAPSAGLPHPA